MKIVAIGGGTGLPAVLRAVRILLGPSAPPEAITAVVSVTDDGGSSGRLRRELGILPPGDARNCVAALAGDTSPLAALLQHRFDESTGLEGHPVGNLVLAALTRQMNGDFASAVDQLGRFVGAGGRVLPATADDVHLRAEYTTGDVQVGESAIASRRLPIHRLSLERPVRPLPEVIQALVNADLVIVGPGSLYTSILPVLLVDGVARTIFGLRATRLYVANLMTEPGETSGHSLEQHLDVIERHVGAQIFDHVLVNTRPIPPMSLARYASEAAYPVQRESTGEWRGAVRIVERELAWQVQDGKIRHEPTDLAAAIVELLSRRRPADCVA
jgi:uncharacterized cofD-like protein